MDRDTLIDNAKSLIRFVLESGKNFSNGSFAAQLVKSFPDLDFFDAKDVIKDARALVVEERIKEFEKEKERKAADEFADRLAKEAEDRMRARELRDPRNLSPTQQRKRRRLAQKMAA